MNTYRGVLGERPEPGMDATG